MYLWNWQENGFFLKCKCDPISVETLLSKNVVKVTPPFTRGYESNKQLQTINNIHKKKASNIHIYLQKCTFDKHHERPLTRRKPPPCNFSGAFVLHFGLSFRLGFRVIVHVSFRRELGGHFMTFILRISCQKWWWKINEQGEGTLCDAYWSRNPSDWVRLNIIPMPVDSWQIERNTSKVPKRFPWSTNACKDLEAWSWKDIVMSLHILPHWLL